MGFCSGLLEGIHQVSRWLHGVAGVSLIFLMLLTILDVVLRAFRRPIPGTYELVGFAGAVAIGCAMPLTSWRRGHVYVDFLLGRLPPRLRTTSQVATRLVAAALFGLLAWNLVAFGQDLRASGEVSPTLELHFYPVAFGFAVAAAFQALVLLADLAKIRQGEYE
ncbi:MAG: TRAP transporter small permease [Candidatus Latescibacterota bacterium]|jgi:TRAP-type C4-dicarboxylate transport system permease small subunit